MSSENNVVREGLLQPFKSCCVKVKADVVSAILGKMIQSNGRFCPRTRLEVHLDHV